MSANPPRYRETIPHGLWLPEGVGLTLDDYTSSDPAKWDTPCDDHPLAYARELAEECRDDPDPRAAAFRRLVARLEEMASDDDK